MANSPTSTAGAGSWRCRFPVLPGMTGSQAWNDEKRGRSLQDRPLVVKGGAVSRFLFLNLPFIFATYPPASDGPPSSAGIFGLAGLPPYPPYVAARRRGLLPRVFTLAPGGAVILCYGRKRLLPSVLSTARRPALCGLSSPRFLRYARNDSVIPGMTARQIVPPFSVAKVRKKLYFCWL